MGDRAGVDTPSTAHGHGNELKSTPVLGYLISVTLGAYQRAMGSNGPVCLNSGVETWQQ